MASNDLLKVPIYSPIDYLHIANKCVDSKPKFYYHYSFGLIALAQYFYFTIYLQNLHFYLQSKSLNQKENKLDSLNKFERI